jgi:hypothetical protein
MSWPRSVECKGGQVECHLSARPDNLERPWSVECEVDGEGEVRAGRLWSLESRGKAGQLEGAVVSRLRGRRRRRSQGRGHSSARTDNLNVKFGEWSVGAGRSLECKAEELNLNVKFKFSESASDIQNNENECFGVSELNGRKLEIKWF